MVKSTFVRWLLGVSVALLLVWSAYAEIPADVSPARDLDRTNSVESQPFADYTDAELTEIAGRIRMLNAAERRGLIMEMRRRMAASGLKPKIEAHYGRIIQSADGTVTQVESIRVIQQGEYGRGRGNGTGAEAKSETKSTTKTVAIEHKKP
ncbi:MAG: hypothetical protein VB933_03280 [Pseudomonadales bacterium]